MQRYWFVGALVVALGVLDRPPTWGQTAADNGILQQWSGRVSRAVALEAPTAGFIIDAAAFTKLWQACQFKADVPVVDFAKDLVLVATSRASYYKVRAVQLDARGDLKTVVIATPDLTRDYAIVLTQVSRAGVKSVHGQSVEP